MSNSKSNNVSIQHQKSDPSADRCVTSVPVRLLPQTKKKLDGMVQKINKGRAGKKVKSSDLLDYSVGLLTEAHLKEISSRTLSNKDRFELLFRQAQKTKRNLSKDDFLGVLLSGKVDI